MRKDIVANTQKGSEILLVHMLPKGSKEYKQTKRVYKNLEMFLDKTVLEYLTYAEMMQVANLHLIGHNGRISKTTIPQYNAYIYLKDNQWEEVVCNAVLMQELSYEFFNIRERQTLANLPLSDLKLLVLAKYTTSQEGKQITLKEKMKEIIKCGEDVEHAKFIMKVLYTDLEIVRLIEMFNLD